VAALERGGGGGGEIGVAIDVKARAQSLRESSGALQRGLSALADAEASLKQGKLEQAQLQSGSARKELGAGGGGFSQEEAQAMSRLLALEADIESRMQAVDVHRRIPALLEAAETALELSQLPGRRGKVAEARGHVQKAIEALASAKDDVRRELQAGVGEVEGKVKAREEWARWCDQGDELLSSARASLAEGELDEASKACRGAKERYEKVSAHEMLKHVEEVVGLIEQKRQVGFFHREHLRPMPLNLFLQPMLRRLRMSLYGLLPRP
jgi:tetratricopeptide (TPR) repeat protein